MSQFDLDDLPSNHSDNEHFQHVVDRVVSRRGFLKSGLGLGAAAFLAVPLAAQAAQHAHQHMGAGYGNNGPRTAPKIGFAPSDWICSFVAERTSVAETCAPRRLAVAIA